MCHQESDIRTLLGKRELRRNKGQSVTCLGHDNCTSNIPADDNIGNEKRWAGQCLDEVQQDSSPITLSYLTTDGDSTALEPPHSCRKHWKPKDLRHFFDSQRKQTWRVPFSGKMFLGETDSPGISPLNILTGPQHPMQDRIRKRFPAIRGGHT